MEAMPNAEAATMLSVRVGCRFAFDTPRSAASVFLVRPKSGRGQLVSKESWTTAPELSRHDYEDTFGNVCRRVTLPEGTSSLTYDALVETTGELDPYQPDAVEHNPISLPDESLMYTLPSRYCVSDTLAPKAIELFGGLTPGWSRVQAVCDWVNSNIAFAYGSSTPLTTAADVLEKGVGVCRDFAHLGIAFCRALNIPARYAFGYIPDYEVPPPYTTMDFCAWFEAYLGGRWWVFDPRNNVRRKGRITIARGRDALDVAMVTIYGAALLEEMTVWADAA
jgi:transglutaminase-like putative cysteine protease